MDTFENYILRNHVVGLGHCISNDKKGMIDILKKYIKNKHLVVGDDIKKEDVKLYKHEDVLFIYPSYKIYEEARPEQNRNYHLILLTYGIFEVDIPNIVFFEPTNCKATYVREEVREKEEFLFEKLFLNILNSEDKKHIIIDTEYENEHIHKYSEFFDVFTPRALHEFNVSTNKSVLISDNFDLLDAKNIKELHILSMNEKIIPLIINLLSNKNNNKIPKRLNIIFYIDLDDPNIIEDYNYLLSMMVELESLYLGMMESEKVFLTDEGLVLPGY